MHIPHFPLVLNRELAQLYASIALRNFTLGLIAIFVPIYIFLFFSQDISKTFLFFGTIGFFQGVLSPLAGKIIAKIGVKHSMLSSVPVIFMYYLGLWQIEALGGFFFILIPIVVLHNLLYWPAFHIGFSRFSEERSRGKQLSYRHLVAALASSLAPLIGGLILVKFGYPALFAIVLILLFSSIFPLFLSQEVHETFTDSFQKAYREVFQKKYKNKAVALFAEGAEGMIHITIWPIFLYILSVSYSSIGIISSVALFAGLLFALYMGRLIDKMGHGKYLALGAWLNALTWPIKMFAHTPLDAFLVHTMHQFTRLSAYMPFSTLFYDWTARHDANRDRFVIFREMTHNIGGGVVMFFFAGLFLFTENIALAFPVAGVFALLMTLFTKGTKEK